MTNNSAQVLERDPFSIAKQKVPNPEAQVLKNEGLFDAQTPNLPDSRLEPQSLSQLIPKGNVENSVENVENSDFFSLLGQYGLGDMVGKLNLNSIGKFQLLDRMTREFGGNLESNPIAKKILREFEQIIKGDDSEKNMMRTTQATERTLEELLR